jgi:hypothetical protein
MKKEAMKNTKGKAAPDVRPFFLVIHQSCRTKGGENKFEGQKFGSFE